MEENNKNKNIKVDSSTFNLSKARRIINDLPKVENVTSSSGNSVKNQFIIKGKGWELLQSYQSPIVLIVSEIGNWNTKTYLFKDWDYSHTTSKYRCQFLGENKATTLKKLQSGEYIAVDFEVLK